VATRVRFFKFECHSNNLYGLLFSLTSCRYDAQLSRLRASPASMALELPIPIIDVPLHRFSEPNLRFTATDMFRPSSLCRLVLYAPLTTTVADSASYLTNNGNLRRGNSTHSCLHCLPKQAKSTLLCRS
jgi:hypothetical protein